MAQANKIEKPRILTESDQILNDLKVELASLRSRMSSIEEEQEQNRSLIERISFQEDLANEMIASHQEEIRTNRENFQVIANAMNSLKSPVSNVVENLSEVISEIDDEETRETLEECMNTAANVLHSFNDVESFCLAAGVNLPVTQTPVTVRHFFRDIISRRQIDVDGSRHTFRLLIDKNVPERKSLHTECIETCLHNLIQELTSTIPASTLTIQISTIEGEQKYGIALSDLCIQVKSEHPTTLVWNDSWVDAIRENQNKMVDSGFGLLKTRDVLRKTGGHLDVLSNQCTITGFRFMVPLTY